MDFNNFKRRLKRLYASVDARFEEDVKECINVHKPDGPSSDLLLSISFDKHLDKDQMQNQIMIILHNLANLKDHFENLLKEKNKINNKDDFKSVVRKSQALCMVIDLVNQEKHGYPLDFSRAKKYHGIEQPKIKNINTAARFKPANNSYIFHDGVNDKIQTKGAKVIITGDIFDVKGNKVCTLGKLIEDSISEWEKIIEKFNIKRIIEN